MVYLFSIFPNKFDPSPILKIEILLQDLKNKTLHPDFTMLKFLGPSHRVLAFLNITDVMAVTRRQNGGIKCR